MPNTVSVLFSDEIQTILNSTCLSPESETIVYECVAMNSALVMLESRQKFNHVQDDSKNLRPLN